MLLKVVGFFAIVALAARAPLLFLIICIVLKYSFANKKLINILVLSFVVFSSYVYIYPLLAQMDLFELADGRLSDLGSRDSEAYGVRLEFISLSLELIGEYPFLGIGYGSFGIFLDGIDGRAYPHNFILELAVELGLLGLILGLTLLFSMFILIKKGLYYSKIYPAIFGLTLSIIYVMANSFKSSSFIDLRDLFLLIGVLIAYFRLISTTKKLSTIHQIYTKSSNTLTSQYLSRKVHVI